MSLEITKKRKNTLKRDIKLSSKKMLQCRKKHTSIKQNCSKYNDANLKEIQDKFNKESKKCSTVKGFDKQIKCLQKYEKSSGYDKFIKNSIKCLNKVCDSEMKSFGYVLLQYMIVSTTIRKDQLNIIHKNLTKPKMNRDDPKTLFKNNKNIFKNFKQVELLYELNKEGNKLKGRIKVLEAGLTQYYKEFKKLTPPSKEKSSTKKSSTKKSSTKKNRN